MTEIMMSLKSDKKGYVDRQCPDKKCNYVFKICADDWNEKVSDEIVYCPMCGGTAISDKWNTQEQMGGITENAKSWVMNYAQTELNNVFQNCFPKRAEKNKFFSITYKPGEVSPFINRPIKPTKIWRLDIECKKCNTRYSVIGSAYFCPCCGYNAVEDAFEKSLDIIEKKLLSIPELNNFYTQKFNEDDAKTMCRKEIEGSVNDIVSAFQKYAAEIYRKNAHDKKVRMNDFQIVEKGSNLFKELFNYGYEKWLSEYELIFMNLMFQRRHILEHNDGFIDEPYLQKTQDITYRVGQRLIVSMNDPIALLGIIKKLSKGLKTLNKQEDVKCETFKN